MWEDFQNVVPVGTIVVSTFLYLFVVGSGGLVTHEKHIFCLQYICFLFAQFTTPYQVH